MKQALAGLALGALLCSPASADTTLEFDTFTIRYIDGSSPSGWDMSFLGQTPLTTSISLDSLNRDLESLPADDVTGLGATSGSGAQAGLRFEVRDGYRITGFSLHALAYGELAAGQAQDAEPGRADNLATFAYLLTVPGAGPQTGTWQREDFNGHAPIALAPASLSLNGTFDLFLGATTYAQAWGSVGPDGSSGSHALASIGNALLNVQVTPVPEPGSWAMLLAGLGLVAIAARRRGN